MQEKLLLLRKRHSYTQEYVANYLGISTKQYNYKERGLSEFTSDEMFKLGDLFDKKLDEIFLPRNHRNGDKIKLGGK